MRTIAAVEKQTQQNSNSLKDTSFEMAQSLLLNQYRHKYFPPTIMLYLILILNICMVVGRVVKITLLSSPMGVYRRASHHPTVVQTSDSSDSYWEIQPAGDGLNVSYSVPREKLCPWLSLTPS